MSEHAKGIEFAEPIVDMKSAVKLLVRHARKLMKERFENPEKPENYLDFHREEHILGAINRIIKILEAVREASPESVSDEDMLLAELLASLHDEVQGFVEVNGMRQRFIDKNESATADELEELMDKVNLNSQSGNIFSEENKKTGRLAIMCTVPKFNPDIGTVVQPYLSESSPLIAKALALADLGTAGMEGGEKYIREGFSLFREDNMDVTEAMRNPSQITTDQKENFRQRMVKWSISQISFAKGRQSQLDAELAGMPAAAINAVKQLFNKFDESITMAEEKAKEQEKMNFEKLAEEFGYNLAA